MLNAQISGLFAQETAFTYQGRLDEGGNPAAGRYDFRFRLTSDSQGNSYVGAAVATNGVEVANGLFAATLDFGAAFAGANRWLEISVRTNGAANYAVLAPLH